MAAEFDPKALADRVIAERKLTADTITHLNGRLEFSPKIVGDAAYIIDTVKRLTPAERRTLAATADVSDSAQMQAAYRALHIDPSRCTAAQTAANHATAALALLIAQRLQVEVLV